MNNTRKLGWAMGLGAAMALSGCWLDSDDEEPPPPVVVVVPPVVVPPVVVAPAVPDSAGLSVGAFISYLLALSKTDETSEPLVIKDGFAVPADESSEPQVLI
jgi:hypothetical protein